MTTAFTYPAMLRVQGQKCIVVGGGAVAARKVATLAAAGAEVTCVAPQFCARLQELATQQRVTLVQACYAPAQLTGALIVVAATNDAAVNAQITRDAPALVNNVSAPETGNFSVPASYRQGGLTLAVATSGFPMLSRRLRDDVAEHLPPDVVALDEWLLTARKQVQHLLPTPEARTAFWRQHLPTDALARLRRGEAAQLQTEIAQAIDALGSPDAPNKPAP